MLIFAEIPADYLSDLQALDARSNAYPLSAENLADSYRHFKHLGLFSGNRLIAFVLYSVVADEAEIIHLVCDQAEQGKGYAYRLFTQLMDKETHVKIWHLEVRAGNMAAQRLYEKLGFAHVGRRKSYYRNQEDALLMKRVKSQTPA